jgi:4,5-DOPA dioxygenase extradiol
VLHDFGGFPAPLYGLDYPAPGEPGLARRVAESVGASMDPIRPLDHGVWTVLRQALPRAELPVVQLSLPRWSPGQLVELGARLAPLREEGVLILASGGLVHNLRKVDFEAPDGTAEGWALEAEAWFLDRIQKGDSNSLTTHRELAPLSHEAAPTTEHLDPLFVALGAGGGDPSRTLFAGWQHGNLSLRTLAWEAP